MTLPTALSKSTQTEALAAPPGCSRRTRSSSRLWVWVGVCGLLLSGLAVARLGSSVAQGEAESQ
ncbi:MAG: hypothetical protein AAFY30_15845, partial [Cyanobacteria bacterium J06642_12]